MSSRIINKSLYKDLKKINHDKNLCKNINSVPYKNLYFYALVIKVIDGDTIKIIYKINSDDEFLKTNIRLFGIDAPELKSKNLLEQNAAKKVKEFLQNIILGKVIVIQNLNHDKYGGRIISNIFSKDKKINYCELLKEKNLVKEYFGKKKEEWKDSELKKILEI